MVSVVAITEEIIKTKNSSPRITQISGIGPVFVLCDRKDLQIFSSISFESRLSSLIILLMIDFFFFFFSLFIVPSSSLYDNILILSRNTQTGDRQFHYHLFFRKYVYFHLHDDCNFRFIRVYFLIQTFFLNETILNSFAYTYYSISDL